MAEAKDLASWTTVPPIAGHEKGEMRHDPAIETSGHFDGSPTLAVDDHSEQRATLCLLANCQF